MLQLALGTPHPARNLKGLCCFARRMANSQYEYVKGFERETVLLQHCWVVVRIDGKGFTKYAFRKCLQTFTDLKNPMMKEHLASWTHLQRFGARGPPNFTDELIPAFCVIGNALGAVNATSQMLLWEVMKQFQDVKLAFGQSDEYSFVLDKHTKLYGRRAMKIVSTMTSCFTSHYVALWPDFLPDKQLQYAPVFDGRAVEYPSDKVLRDYLAWRQVDTHVNNQYNTCFWALVKSGLAPKEAQEMLKGTQKDFKNELLYSQFGINYNELPEQFKKGTTIVWEEKSVLSRTKDDGTEIYKMRKVPCVKYVDLIKDKFWRDHPWVLG